MKATELMVGDWVNSDFGIFQIKEIFDDCVRDDRGNDYEFDCIYPYCTVKKPHVNITCDECYVLETPAKTVVGRNGFFSMVDKNNLYAVINNENKQEVYCLGLPKSKDGLTSGRLWRNGTQLCIIE